ncbi:alkaline phosphatase D family protein, partial [Pseudomonas aeruginosa]
MGQGRADGLLLPALAAPAAIAPPRGGPKLTDGVQSGGGQGDGPLVWRRTDRQARMIVEWDTRSDVSELGRLVTQVTDARLDY